MKPFLCIIAFLSICFILQAQNVGIGTSNPILARLVVEQNRPLLGSGNEAELIVHNTAPTFTRMLLRNNTLGYWSLESRIGNLLNSSEDTFRIRTDFEPNFFVMRGNGQVGINTANPLYRLHVEGANRPGIFVRTNNNLTDSGAILAILDVPTPAQPYSAAVRAENKSTTFNGVGVYGVHNGGGWGVYGLAKEAGDAGYGAGVNGRIIGGTGGSGVRGENYNSGGAGGVFLDGAANGNSRALKTQGSLQFTGINEGAGKVLTSDGSGVATWQTLAGTHNHFGETWTGSVSNGLRIENNQVTSSGLIVLNNAGSGQSHGIQGQSNSNNGIGIIGANTNGGLSHVLQTNAGINGIAGNGTGVYAASVSGVSLFAHKFNSLSAAGTVAKFQNEKIGNTSPVVLIQGVSAQPALELNNGFLKVSGTDKTAFTVTATASNSSGHVLDLSYANPERNDIVIVTHNYNPLGAPAQYHDQAVGVYWNGSTWSIYNENTTIPILNRSFNVLIIRQ
ncbi:MAG: hypothetical protein MUE71_04730 [Chitinophagaceae bacterium]|nr:hypothetical protein [Chitinophagaceae bacterium]